MQAARSAAAWGSRPRAAACAAVPPQNEDGSVVERRVPTGKLEKHIHENGQPGPETLTSTRPGLSSVQRASWTRMSSTSSVARSKSQRATNRQAERGGEKGRAVLKAGVQVGVHDAVVDQRHLLHPVMPLLVDRNVQAAVPDRGAIHHELVAEPGQAEEDQGEPVEKGECRSSSCPNWRRGRSSRRNSGRLGRWPSGHAAEPPNPCRRRAGSALLSFRG